MRFRSLVVVRVWTAGVMVASILGASALAAGPAVAHTAAQSTTCKLKSTIKFNPGLTFSEANQKLKIKGKLSSCNGGGVASATFAGKGSGKLSCTSGTATAKLTVTWNTSETSGVSLTIDVGAGSFSGTVVSGKFAGEPVTASNVSLEPVDGDCFFTPVTKAKATALVSL